MLLAREATVPKRWNIAPHDATTVAALEKSAGISPILARLLAARGVTDPKQVRGFLDASMSNLREPEELFGIAEAADSILAAAKAGRKIVIYGDYDADGMSSTAILCHCLAAIHVEPHWYVPDRFDEGYGLNSDALRRLKEDGAELVVTVDCGIASVAEADVAREIGLELIITDHHNFADRLPAADVIVHPRLPGSEYPFGDLCGAGVAFKLAWAVATRSCGAKQVTPRLREMLLQCVGLAAVGTVADVVPLLDENRVYVKYGLKCLREKGGPGVSRLLELAKLSEKSSLESEDIAFRFAPRLNAAGRLGQAGCGIELLTTSDKDRATTLANYLHELNGQRETEERSIQLSATKQAKEKFHPETDSALVLAGRGWHAGVIGIVAGRLAERWHRPVVMLARDELLAKPAIGSVRSVPGFDVHAALQACRDLLLTCGGHAAAAGLRIEDGKIDAFREAFLAEVTKRMPKELRQAQIQLDGETTLAGVTLQSVGELERLAPFGQGNKRPYLCASGVACAEPPRTMGNGDKHMSVKLVQNGVQIRAVAFGGAEWIPHLPPPGEPFNIAFKPKINEFRGRRTAEIELLDWRPNGIDVSVDLPTAEATP